MHASDPLLLQTATYTCNTHRILSSCGSFVTGHWGWCCRCLVPSRYKLSLLHSPGNQGPTVPVTFKDFSDEKATTKAKKAAASSKGFGAAAPKQAGAAAAAATPATELSAEQLTAVLGCNAYGDDHLDGGLTCCRQEQQGSIIGESTLCNSSLPCKPARLSAQYAGVLTSSHTKFLAGLPAGFKSKAAGMQARQSAHNFMDRLESGNASCLSTG